MLKSGHLLHSSRQPHLHLVCVKPNVVAMIGRAGSCPALGSFVVALLLLCSSAAAFETLDLNSADWKVSNKNGSVEITKVKLPSYPVEELRKLGIVQDPQYRCERINCASRWT